MTSTTIRTTPGVSRHLWTALFLAIGIAFVALTDASTVHVTAPLACGVAAAALFFWALWCRRYPLVPWFEVGAVYLTVVTLYMAYPLIGYLALGQVYTPLNDSRLTQLQPGPEEVGSIGWLYVWHLVSFALTYLIVRGRTRIRSAPLRRPGTPVFIAVVAIYLAIEGFVIFLGLFYNIGAQSYAETYLAVRRLPLLFAQLANHLSGIKYVLSIMLLAALFSRYSTSKPIIAAWIVVSGAVTMARLGSRTQLVLLVLSAAMMYHSVVKPLSPRVVLSIAATGLTGFIVFGILRNGMMLPGGGIAWNPFVYASEFENLFANGVHLARVKDSIPELPMAFYLADFAALVPQQFAPFVKVDRADWYVVTFFPEYAAIGGGLAFGTIAEVILTGGWISAVARGMVLGIAFGALHRFYVRHMDRFWVFVFYVWVTTLSYQTFRNSTFALLVLIAFRFLPALLVVNILARMLKRSTHRDPGPVVAGAARA
jgi:oligosaccharide repeat unit polymerase